MSGSSLLGLPQGDDCQGFPKGEEELQDGIELGAGVALLHPGNDRLLDAAQLLQLLLADALLLAGLDELTNEGHTEVAASVAGEYIAKLL